MYHEVQDLWQSDEDMAGMYLTTRAITGHPRRIDQHEEVEALLETYIRQVCKIFPPPPPNSFKSLN